MLESALKWLVGLVESWGYLGIFAMMFLESSFFPFPSEVAMIPAGFLASHGRMDPVLAILAGLGGSLAGAYFNYFLAQAVGIPVLRRYGRYIFFDERKLDRASALFRRHGEITTFICRLIPVVRQYISLPAGISRMKLLRFGLYTALGAGAWVAILTGFGYWVGRKLEEAEASAAWGRMKESWREHELKIYLGLAIPLLVIVAVYWALQRRRRPSPAAGKAPSSPSEAAD